MATTLDDAAVEATRLFCVTMDAIARHPHASKLLAHGCDRLRAAIRAEAERLCTEFDVTVTTEETQQ